jgi:hypothetical protein
MRCLDRKRPREAEKTNEKALEILPFLLIARISVLIATQILL